MNVVQVQEGPQSIVLEYKKSLQISK